MGSVFETVCETVDYLNKSGRKTGALHVYLYRPFCTKRFLDGYSGLCEKNSGA